MRTAVGTLLLLAMALLAIHVHANGDRPAPALSGYDVVSYFTHGKAEKGSEQFAYIHEGLEYRFTSAEQKRMFIESPGRYLPQYDGFCAYGVTIGRKLEASPEAWKIVDGKLYLNLNRDFLASWSKDVEGNIRAGDEQWELIRDIPASELQ